MSFLDLAKDIDIAKRALDIALNEVADAKQAISMLEEGHAKALAELDAQRTKRVAVVSAVRARLETLYQSMYSIMTGDKFSPDGMAKPQTELSDKEMKEMIMESKRITQRKG